MMKMSSNLHNFRLSLNGEDVEIGEDVEDGEVKEEGEDVEDVEAAEETGDGEFLLEAGYKEDAVDVDVVDGDFIYMIK